MLFYLSIGIIRIYKIFFGCCTPDYNLPCPLITRVAKYRSRDARKKTGADIPRLLPYFRYNVPTIHAISKITVSQ